MQNSIVLTDSEKSLVETLDMLIGEKAFRIATDCLTMVEETFSLYDLYVGKLGRAINNSIAN
jgi:hypothetical protein